MDSDGNSENHAQDEKRTQGVQCETLLLDDPSAHVATPS